MIWSPRELSRTCKVVSALTSVAHRKRELDDQITTAIHRVFTDYLMNPECLDNIDHPLGREMVDAFVPFVKAFAAWYPTPFDGMWDHLARHPKGHLWD